VVSSSRRDRNLETSLAVIAVAAILVAWVLSRFVSGTAVEPFLEQALPEAKRFQPINGDLYSAWGPGETGPEVLIGYVAIGEASGYGGPLKMAVGVSPQGEVLGMAIIEHKETPTFLYRVMRMDFPKELIGKRFSDRIQLGEDVDAVSGATLTSRAMAEVVRDSVYRVASDQLGLQPPLQEPQKLIIGIPELAVAAFFGAGYIGHKRKFKYTKQLRWASMLGGMLVLGFIYNIPLTLAHFNSLLMGYWPDWHTDLYWYLLLGGILFVFTVDNKNPYCEWFCPFGAAQECMAALGGAKARTPRRYRLLLLWSQRGLAWLAIILGLLLRNPGMTSFEIFGTLFNFTGSKWQFGLLGIIIVASLFIRRPWCNYLCPVRPVVDFIRFVRGWIKGLWLKRKSRTVQSSL